MHCVKVEISTMKKFLLLALFGVCALHPVVSNANTAEAALKEVYVYLQGARLSYQAQLPLASGQQRILLAGFADGADESSTRILLPRGLQLLHYQWQHQPLRGLAEPGPLKGGYDSLNNLRAEIDALRMRREVLQQEQQLLLANKQLGGNQGVQVAELQKMAIYFRQRLSELGQSLLDLQQQEKKLVVKSDELKKSLEQRKVYLAEFENVLIAEVIVGKAGNYQLEISYNCDRVSWEPTYVLRSEGPGKPIQLTMQAQISQNTGLAWKDVRVKLAAYMPASQLQKPVLSPWVLDFIEQRPVAYQRNSAVPMAADAGILEKNVVAMPEEESWAGVQRNNQFFTANYQPEAPLSLQHGEQKRLRIEQRELTVQYEHYLAPRFGQEVLLLARIPLVDSLPQLPGQTQIYFENSLVNTLWLDFAAENDTLDLPLGVDKALVVKFNTAPVLSDKKRFSNTAIKNYSYELEVKNNRNQIVNLLVQDQLPITAQKEIEITDITLQGASLDQEKGFISQNWSIPAGGSKNWKYGWQVRYPANKRVAGL
jgi:uncharacterized protein (TIGR02231 family)